MDHSNESTLQRSRWSSTSCEKDREWRKVVELSKDTLITPCVLKLSNKWTLSEKKQTR